MFIKTNIPTNIHGYFNQHNNSEHIMRLRGIAAQLKTLEVGYDKHGKLLSSDTTIRSKMRSYVDVVGTCSLVLNNAFVLNF
ncbi:hypothetical protein MTR_2g006990 [Medicago truncatula]|uniref:Uncharacterized protein n=1 Tax=Medicago truncatula TaxID=3880 RepID=G7IPG9_MEDTR|nr:hypothetical protein MTR_2g006990 [Medicago truncatula]